MRCSERGLKTHTHTHSHIQIVIHAHTYILYTYTYYGILKNVIGLAEAVTDEHNVYPGHKQMCVVSQNGKL